MPRKHPPVLQQNPVATPEDVAKALLQRVKPYKKSLRPKNKPRASPDRPSFPFRHRPPPICQPLYIIPTVVDLM